MSTLVELFDQQREHLRLRLGEHPDREHTIREIKNFLGVLLTTYGQEKDHQLTDRRVFGFLLDLGAAAIGTLAESEIVTDAPDRSIASASLSGTRERGRWVLRSVYAAIAIALAGMLFQAGAGIALALLGALVLLSVREWLSPSSSAVAPSPPPPVHLRIIIDASRVLSQLREVMKAMDMILTEIGKPPTGATSALEEDGALLDLMHELLRAAYAEDGEYALKHLNTLAFVFARQGVTLQNFTVESHPLFDTVPDLSPQSRTWRTLKPALVRKDGRVLRRGLVAEPTVSKEHLH